MQQIPEKPSTGDVPPAPAPAPAGRRQGTGTAADEPELDEYDQQVRNEDPRRPAGYAS